MSLQQLLEEFKEFTIHFNCTAGEWELELFGGRGEHYTEFGSTPLIAAQRMQNTVAEENEEKKKEQALVRAKEPLIPHFLMESGSYSAIGHRVEIKCENSYPSELHDTKRGRTFVYRFLRVDKTLSTVRAIFHHKDCFGHVNRAIIAFPGTFKPKTFKIEWCSQNQKQTPSNDDSSETFDSQAVWECYHTSTFDLCY